MKKGQSSRLTEQQKEGQGPITIFHKDAQIHSYRKQSIFSFRKSNPGVLQKTPESRRKRVAGIYFCRS